MAEQVSQIKVEIDTEEAQAKLNQLYETQAKLVGEMSKVEEGSDNDVSILIKALDYQICID